MRFKQRIVMGDVKWFYRPKLPRQLKNCWIAVQRLFQLVQEGNILEKVPGLLFNVKILLKNCPEFLSFKVTNRLIYSSSLEVQ